MESAGLGDYRLIATLGRGGMADVFLAVRGGLVGFTKLVVVKRLRADLASREDGGRYRTLLLDEARIAARLQHRNIVQTFEVVDHPARPFLAMEYLDGQPLHRVMVKARRAGIEIPAELALAIIADVLAALEHAHDLVDFDGRPLGIVHRDVSPQNVFWTYDGGVKLMDFGIAKFAFGRDETEVGVLKGKVEYMAPEQARGQPIDRRADVFAAGIVLWELLAGRRLLRAKTQTESLERLLLAPLPDLGEVRPELDPAIARICATALARDLERRYQSAHAMRLDIERVLGQRAPRRDDLAAFIVPMFAHERRAVADEIRVALSGVPQQASETPSGSVGPPVLMSMSSPASIPTVALHRASSTSLPRPERRSPWVGLLVAAIAIVAIAIVAVVWPGAAPSPSQAAAATVPAASTSPPVTTQAKLRLCGSNTVGAELAPAIVEAFKRYRPREELIVEMAAHGTATAFEGLAAGTCDIGMASRAINDAEVATLERAGVGDLRTPATEHVIALDGIAVIVHPNNPIGALDRDLLRAVFTGEVTDWARLGGTPGPITVLARDQHSGTFDTFKQLVLGKTELVATAQRFERSDMLSDAVASDPAAIGFIGLAYVRSAKAIAIGDRGAPPMLPTSFTVTTESYLLSRRLYFYTSGKPRSRHVPELVAFALSSKGQQAAKAAGFIDLDVVASQPTACGKRCPRRYAALVAGARRLSVDFRFRRGSDHADSRGTRDLDRVVHFLTEHPDADVLLLGFSDASGSATANLALSRQRAARIAKELATRGVRAAAVEGFGAAMPIAANTSETERERNRRVEIWVR